MNVKNSMKIFLSLMLLLTMAGLSVAEQQGNLPVDYIQMRTAKQLRMVDGGLCGSLPDDAGTTTYSGFRVYCTGKDGVTSDLTGCAVKFYNSKYSEIADRELQPGEYTSAPSDAVFWERYNCVDQSYTCTDYESAGCGESGAYVSCADDEILRVRTCTGAGSPYVDTERCVPWYDCREEDEHCDYRVGPWGECVKGTQTRTVTRVDCTTYTDSQSCSLDCINPPGVPGDMVCQNTYVYECKSTGDWVKSSERCGGSGETCSNPQGSAGDMICDSGIKKECKGDGEWQETGTCTVEKGLKSIFKPLAFYDPTRKAVIGRVGIENEGDDMKDTYIIEMQIRPEGSSPLSFLSDQDVCDEEHPENVHKQFMLDSGENVTIELEVPDSYLGKGEFDVYFMTRHKCFKDLTAEQIENYNSYQRVEPFPYSEKVSGIEIGTGEKKLSTSKLWKAGGIVLALAGIVLAGYFQIIPIGIAAFIIGIIIIIWQYWPW